MIALILTLVLVEILFALFLFSPWTADGYTNGKHPNLDDERKHGD